MEGERKWLTISDVATRFGVSRWTVRRWMNERGLPSHRIIGGRRFLADEVDQWALELSGAETL